MKIKQWQFLILCWGILFFLPAACAAERVEILSPNPVGSGARAMGMGGAFIAIADDATAASWNPGGLIQLEKPEISAVYGYVHRREDNFSTTHQFSDNQSIQDSNLNYMSVAYPFEKIRRNMVLSLNYQNLYDFNREWYLDKTRYIQTGSLYALGLAYCTQITIDFSIGFTINYWGDFLFKNEWEQIHNQISIGLYSKQKFTFEGWNSNIGFLWKIDEHWTLGGVLKTPFTANRYHTSMIYYNNKTFFYEFNEKLSMPMSYGIGAAYRFSDEFTISGDIYRTHWNDFPISASGSGDINPITWFRLGTEYLIVGEKIVVPIRSGIFYDPAPNYDSTQNKGTSDDYYGFSIGSGITFKSFSFDIAYQFRFGNNIMLPDIGGLQDTQEHKVYSSIVYYF